MVSLIHSGEWQCVFTIRKRENLKTVSNQSKIKRVKSQKVAEVKSITSMVLASKGECEKLSAFYHFEFITR